MKNKTVKMVSSVVVLAVLCGAYVGVKTYVAKQEEKENEEEEEETTSVFAASTDDIKSVTFLIDKKEVTFENTDGVWKKSDEEEFPVSQDMLDQIAGALNSVDAERVIDDVEDLTQYGLDSPDNTVVVVTSDGKETTLRIGEENESVSQYYVGKDDDDSTVYLVAAASVTPFMNELYDYAESGTFPDIDSANLSKIQVDGDNSYSLEYISDTWYVSSDETQEKADSAQAASMASSLSSIEYSSFINYDASEDDMITYGLSNPYAEITIDYEEEVPEEESETEETESEDAETEESSESEETSEEEDTEESEPEMISKQLVLHIGNTCDTDTRYVSIDDSKEVYTISTDTLSAFIDKSIEDFWDLTVCYVSVNNLDNIQVVYNGETDQFDVSRETSVDEDGNETETRSFFMNGTELDEGIKFTTFYNKLTNMAGQKRLTDEFEPEETAEMEIQITDTDGQKTSVELYSYDSNYYAVVTDNKVYLVNKMTVRDFFESYEELLQSVGTEEELDTEETETEEMDTEERNEAEETEIEETQESEKMSEE